MPSAGSAKRLVITGASGFLGWHLCCRARSTWTVYGLYRHHPPTVAGVTPVRGDLKDDRSLDKLFRDIRPGAVIHAAARSSPDWCETHNEASRQINILVAERLAARCARESIPFAFTSSDLVFDGSQPPYCESDDVSPVSVYGRHKADAERRVQARHPGALVCRLPNLIGLSGGRGQSYCKTILDAIQTHTPIRLFADEFRTPVDGGTAAAGILMTLGKMPGVLHLGGRTRISRLEVGRRLAAIMGVNDGMIQAVRLDAVDTVARRPPDVSLDSRRAYGLGYAPEDLDRTLQGMLNDYRKRWS